MDARCRARRGHQRRARRRPARGHRLRLVDPVRRLDAGAQDRAGDGERSRARRRGSDRVHERVRERRHSAELHVQPIAAPSHDRRADGVRDEGQRQHFAESWRLHQCEQPVDHGPVRLWLGWMLVSRVHARHDDSRRRCPARRVRAAQGHDLHWHAVPRLRAGDGAAPRGDAGSAASAGAHDVHSRHVRPGQLLAAAQGSARADVASGGSREHDDSCGRSSRPRDADEQPARRCIARHDPGAAGESASARGHDRRTYGVEHQRAGNRGAGDSRREPVLLSARLLRERSYRNETAPHRSESESARCAGPRAHGLYRKRRGRGS